MELLSVSMKVELVGGEWLCCCVKKKVTVQVLEGGDAAELRFATAAGRYWCYTGGRTFTSRLKRRGRLSWVFGRRR